MQASIFKKKGSSHVIKCPRCGAENLTSQSHCGKCGFLFPKEEKDAHKDRKDSPGGAAVGFGSSGGSAGAGNSFGGSGGSAGGSAPPPAPPRALGGPPITQGTDSDQPVQVDEQGNPVEAPKILTAHQKMDTSTEGVIKERGQWMKCPRCFADVKADSIRCMHCGTRFKKK